MGFLSKSITKYILYIYSNQVVVVERICVLRLQGRAGLCLSWSATGPEESQQEDFPLHGMTREAARTRDLEEKHTLGLPPRLWVSGLHPGFPCAYRVHCGIRTGLAVRSGGMEDQNNKTER